MIKYTKVRHSERNKFNAIRFKRLQVRFFDVELLYKFLE